MRLDTADRAEGVRLRGRILNAFPAGHYALDTFFRLSDVVASTTVDTAAVECVVSPKLLLNPKFVAERCKTDEHLFILVMHELHHVLLGHTRLFKRVSELENIAFDAVINALLTQLFPSPVYWSFFTQCYASDKLPDALLRPPEGWPQELCIPRKFPVGIREMIRVLYTPASGTYKEVYDLLVKDNALAKALAAGQGKGRGTLLLGDHSPEGTPGRGEQAANHPALNSAVRAIVEKWPQPPDPIRGRSTGNDIREIFLERVNRPPAADRVLARLLRKMVEASEVGATARRSSVTHSADIQSPIPSPRDRRSFAASLGGATPLIFRDAVPRKIVRREIGITTVYVDVSGSVATYIPLLAALVAPYVRRKQARVYAFSEFVDEVSPRDLARGRFRTTGGTEAACIWKHATEAGFRKLVILTDGYVGAPSHQWKSKLDASGVRIRVALTPDGYLPDLEGVAEEIIELPVRLRSEVDQE